MKLGDFLERLEERVQTIKDVGQYPEYSEASGASALRSSQVLALAERVCGLITHCEALTARVEALRDRVEALEKRRDLE